MKYAFVILEITDGEHEYYSHAVLQYKRGNAEKVADLQARTWYDEKPKVIEPGLYSFLGGEVYAKVYQVREISKDHYEILSQYL